MYGRRGADNPNFGSRRSAETRRLMSEQKRGPLHPGYGVPKTPAQLRKLSEANRGPRNNQWKGGRYVTPKGYAMVWVGPEHPMANHMNYCFEHRLVMAEAIGRPLTRAERVHHVNGDKLDNRLENLMLFASEREHQRHHRELERA